jgi:hypothetical protein
MFKLVAAATLAASLAASAQMDIKPSGHQSADKEKIADALRAGPLFITKDAVIADWPVNPKRIPLLNTEFCEPARVTGHVCPESQDTPMMNQCAWTRRPCNG